MSFCYHVSVYSVVFSILYFSLLHGIVKSQSSVAESCAKIGGRFDENTKVCLKPVEVKNEIPDNEFIACESTRGGYDCESAKSACLSSGRITAEVHYSHKIKCILPQE